MRLLEEISLFADVIQQGGFSHAAKHLGLSNGLVSRRISKLESALKVSLLKRTTRQLQVTPEGKLLWEHAKRIQQELEIALNTIDACAHKPAGIIRIGVPTYLGRHIFTPMILKFLKQFSDIKIELNLSNQIQDPIKEHFDFVIQGAGFSNKEKLNDSNLKVRLLFKDSVGLYASQSFLKKYGEPKSPDDLSNNLIVNFRDHDTLITEEKWRYQYKNKKGEVNVSPRFVYNDIDCGLRACLGGHGIGKFTGLVIKEAVENNQLIPILQNYSWGKHYYYVVYSNQKTLPKRTRLFLDFIDEQMQVLK